jgi:lanthionine synthetase-like protein
MVRKLSMVLGGWAMSMLSVPGALAAEDPSPAELLSRVMPPLRPAVGFEDRRSLTDFIRRSTREKDVAVRALGLSSLGRADINGDHCVSRREYDLYLAMWKRWRSSPRAEMVQTIEDYRSVEAKMTDEVTSYATQLLRQGSSTGEMQLLKQRILLSDENKNNAIDLDELKRFEEIWKSYLRIPYAVVKAYLDESLGTLSTCVAARIQKTEIKGDLQPLLQAQELAAEIEKLLPGLTSYYQMDGKPGVGAFYAELFRQTGKDAYLTQALVLMEDAVTAYRKSGSQSNTLIEGSAGIAFSALSAYRSTGEKRFVELAEQLAAEIGAPPDTEYALGAAGIGIFMLNLAQVTGKTAWRERAVEMASYLLKAAVRANGKAKWRFKAAATFMIGFGHGAAGIGYFFAHLYRATQNPVYKSLAIEAGNYVLSLADRDELGGYHWAAFDPMFRFGNHYQWSHGSPGIGHLFIALDEIDPSERWKRGLAGSMASTSRDGPTFHGIDGNCIRAGQGELFIEAYRATRKEAYYQEALRFGSMLLAERRTGFKDSSGSPCGAGYIFGLAGAGYYFLRLSSPLTIDLPFHVYGRPAPADNGSVLRGADSPASVPIKK